MQFGNFQNFLEICALKIFCIYLQFQQFINFLKAFHIFWKFAIFPISDVLQNLCKIIRIYANLYKFMQIYQIICNKRQLNKSLQQASVEQYFWNKRQLNAQDVTRTMRVLLAVKNVPNIPAPSRFLSIKQVIAVLYKIIGCWTSVHVNLLIKSATINIMI